MIRQAISCDICGTEKKQTNHWFVACDQGGELRVSGWNSRNRLRPGSKHLCGQTCLHKLVDEFMARSISSKPQQSTAEDVEFEVRPVLHDTDASLTSSAAYASVPYETPAYAARKEPAARAGSRTDAKIAVSQEAGEEVESEARLLAPPVAILPKRPPLRVPAHTAETAPHRLNLEPPPQPAQTPPDSLPAFSARNWRAEAWERERERELRAIERRPDIAARRRSNA